jgi:hypothetical protein
MVFVPRYRLSGALLGLSDQLPRLVPIEGIVAVTARLIPTQILQKAILAGAFVLAFAGAGRLIPTATPIGRLAAGTLYAWNPYVYERLLIGHWPLLLAYGTLPWIARAALDVRTGKPGGWPRLGLWLAAASFTGPYGGILATLIALLFCCSPPHEGHPVRAALLAGRALALSIALNIPWIVPALIRPGGVPSSARGLEAFAARSDSPLGLAGSIASLGGAWNTDLAPPGRSSWGWIPGFVLILAVAFIGWRELRRRWPAAAVNGLAIGGGVGLVVALGPHLPVVGGLYGSMLRAVPGGAIFRDSQKYVAPLALTYSVAFGMGAQAALPATKFDPSLRRLGAAVLLALPLMVVPTLAWGAGGRLGTASYPKSWFDARRIMAADPDPGSILVLPWHLHFPLGWNDARVTLDPAQSFFSRQAVTSGHLELRSGPVPPETALDQRADSLIGSGSTIANVSAELGARYVLLLKEGDWRGSSSRLAGLDEIYDAPELTLLRSPLTPASLHVPSPPAPAVVAGDFVAVGAVAAMGAAAVRARAGGSSLLSFARVRSRRRR